ncbi:branched-chain amino acid transport system II carrier protein [Jeotgalibacillus soli]|uniref:Branched-chain amino acid transport system carrier protein n=1 Tax=Jeotgalibacillus soli TaxID=889306 RepID=A0A0C2V4A2_9BACL|nr:branched-chain amino acid transport system II carrier protein [Jeotgalibacillus soli]KIL43862.1 RNA-dirted RNA polymerase [Jeotgalibacillus soli]
MKQQPLSFGSIFAIGLMLFALFFGAGNMIFPPLLGQQAGEHMWIAIFGFLLTGVGLPLLGVIAIAYTGGDPQKLASRAHPIFGIIFTITLYLAIGPFFALPRTGTVTYEIGILPFLPENLISSDWPLLLFSILFFTISAWLSLNPSKIVDRVGKLLTPALLVVLAALIAGAFITPMGEPAAPIGDFENSSFFKGFIEGYLTLDALAALVFAIVVISAVKERGITDRTTIVKITIYSSLIAVTCLALVYIGLSYLGATSIDAVGVHENGGGLLSAASAYMFGSGGAIILGLAIAAACLTTAIGLIVSTSSYFAQLVPSISYKSFVIIFSGFSMLVSNLGLTQLISISVPVLVIIYPLAIVLILLSFLDSLFSGYRAVYVGSLIPTFFIGIVDGLTAAGLDISGLASSLHFLPLMEQGVGWIVPAIIGGMIGYGIASIFKHVPNASNVSS